MNRASIPACWEIFASPAAGRGGGGGEGGCLGCLMDGVYTPSVELLPFSDARASPLKVIIVRPIKDTCILPVPRSTFKLNP